MHKTGKIVGLVLLLALALGAMVFGILYGQRPGEALPPQADSIPAQPDTTGTRTTAIRLADGGTVIDGPGAAVEGGVVKITKAGVFEVSGTLRDGQITVDAGGKDVVVLRLMDVSISHTDGPAVRVENAGQTWLELPAGSVNTLQSGTPVEPSALAGAADADAYGGAVWAQDDLFITGEGALTVLGYINNGIHCSNDLVISGGMLEVVAVHNGIKGKDSLTVTGGDIAVTAGGDGLKSDDTAGEGTGVVRLAGGNITVVCGGDAVQAETLLEVADGVLALTAGGGAAAVDASGQWTPGGFGGYDGGRHHDDHGYENQTGLGGHANDGWGHGMHGGWAPGLPGGFGQDMPQGAQPGEEGAQPQDGVPGAPFGDMAPPDGMEPAPGSPPEGMTPPDGGFGGGAPGLPGGMGNDGFGGLPGGWDFEDANTGSAKGLKSGGDLFITGGSITADTADDAVHADGSITISGGSLLLATGDDGVHAGDSLTVAGGAIEITRSYEGLEAVQLLITGGTVSVVSSDDSLNANGSGRGTGGAGTSLRITGGTVYVNAEGDGLDSNGDLIIEGGFVVVDGPQGAGDGALDAGTESGGVCRISGGTVLAIGAAGMDAGFDESSTQCSFRTRISGGAGSVITITAADGSTLITHIAAGSFSSVVFSCPQLALGESYTVTVDGASVTVLQDETAAGGMGGGWGRRW